jgi:hypothetical protein
MAEPEPRQEETAREIQAATKKVARLMEDYRVGKATATQVHKAERELGAAHYDAYLVSAGRPRDFRGPAD